VASDVWQALPGGSFRGAGLAAAGGDPAVATLLRVVDTPGTCDSGALLDDNLQHISEFLRSSANGGGNGVGDSGVHALVLVLNAAVGGPD